MKKTIVKSDGSSVTIEGTAIEIAEYEKRLKQLELSETPTPKKPSLLTDEVKFLDFSTTSDRTYGYDDA